MAAFRLVASTFLLTLAASTLSSPPPNLETITNLTTAQIAEFKPFTYFAASAGCCTPNSTLTWCCGGSASCDATQGFLPVASGGDGLSVQIWFVGYHPTLRTIIVGHQGTDAKKIVPVLKDALIVMTPLDPSLFPGVSSSILAHAGFVDAHKGQALAATQVLTAVQTALFRHEASHVTIVGHSLGAAIALLDAVYLPLHLPGVTFTTIGYGMPRVGNQAFADYVDAHVSLTRINNKNDPIPTLPDRLFGYHHPFGEVHIEDPVTWTACPGQENTNNRCTAGNVRASAGDHNGPYDGVRMGQC